MEILRKNKTKTKEFVELGAEIGTYPVRNQSYKRVIGTTLGTSIILAAVIFFTLGFYDLVMAVRLHGRAMVLLHAPSLVLMLAFLPIGVVILLYTALNWDNHITLFERGLILKQGIRTKMWIWEGTTRLDTHITHIKFGGSIIDIRVRFILGNPQETLTTRNKYEEMSTIIQEVRARVLPLLAKWASQRMKKGQTIEFSNKLIASKQSLIINGEPFNWNQIDAPIIKNRQLILQESKNHQNVFQTRLNQITNLDLLISLLNHPPGAAAQSLSR